MRPIMPPVQTPDNLFHDGNPLTGELGTIVDANHLNNVQASVRDAQSELISILTAAAKVPDSSSVHQLLDALKILFEMKDAALTSLAGLVSAADTLPYFTGPDTFSLTSLTVVGRNLISQNSIANALYYLQGAPINSPSFTGTPFAPTAPAGTNNTQIATTQFAQSLITVLLDGAPAALNTLNKIATAINNDPSFAANVVASLNQKAPLASPSLTGSPKAPTATAGDNSTLLATTAFVTAALATFLPKRSFGLNDFIRLPDVPGGLILQWGTTAGTGADGLITSTLPTPFPNNNGICGVCAYYSGSRNAITTQVASITQSSIQLFASSAVSGAAAASAQIRYFVLGY